MKATVRSVIGASVSLRTPIDEVGDDADLYQLGLTSHATVDLMIALEDEFGVEFPNHLLRRSTFQSVANIVAALEEVGAGQARA